MYAIMGASGNTGKAAATSLLQAGKKVRVIGRDPNHLKQHAEKGAEVKIANILNPAELTAAFSGAEAVYLMIPPNPGHPNTLEYDDQVIRAITTALEETDVEHAVVLSSIGADKPSKTGPVLGLHNLEEKLNALPELNAVYLRAGYFMENLLSQVGVIKSFGMMAGPVRGDLKLPLIAARDIGAAAANELLKLSFRGKQTRELLGQRNVTYQEAASIIGKAIGKSGLSYMQLPNAQLKPTLMQMGMSPNFVDLLLEMTDSLNTGYMAPLDPRSAQNTTPTSFEAFVAEEFVPHYTGKAAGA